MGVNQSMPVAPRFETVNVPSRSAVPGSEPSRAAAASPPASVASSLHRLTIRVADDRDDHALVQVHRQPEVHGRGELDPFVDDAGVQARVLAQRRGRPRAVTA